MHNCLLTISRQERRGLNQAGNHESAMQILFGTIYSQSYLPFLSPLSTFDINLKMLFKLFSLPMDLLTWFLMQPVLLLHKRGFPHVAFGIRHMNRGSFLFKIS